MDYLELNNNIDAAILEIVRVETLNILAIVDFDIPAVIIN